MYLWDIPEDTKIVMLACTHYPRLTIPLAESIERRLGKTVVYKTIDGDWILKIGSRNTTDPIFLVETSLPIVNFVSDFISENSLEASLYHGEKRVLCTDSPEQFESIARFFTSIPLPKVEAVEIQT